MRKEGMYFFGTVEEIVKEIADKTNFDWRSLEFPNFDFCIIPKVFPDVIEDINNNMLKDNVNHSDEQWFGIKFVNTGFDSEGITLIGDMYGGSCMACADLWDREYAENELIELIENVADKYDGYKVKCNDYLLGIYA